MTEERPRDIQRPARPPHIETIRAAVKGGLIPSDFKVKDIETLGIYRGTAATYLSKHRVGNGVREEYFERVERGVYKLKT